MKVCILSTKCSKWKAALNSTLSVNLRWVWWKHSWCIFFPGITRFVNTFHGSFKSWICFNKFQPPKKRWGFHHLRSKETQAKQKNDTRKSPQLDFCAPGVAPAVHFFQWLRRGFLWGDTWRDGSFSESVGWQSCFQIFCFRSKVESPQNKKMSSGKVWDVLFGSFV